MREDRSTPTELAYQELVRDGPSLKARLYRVDGVECWVPKSQIIEDDGSSITIPEWLFGSINEKIAKGEQPKDKTATCPKCGNRFVVR